MTTDAFEIYLSATDFFDIENPAIRDLVHDIINQYSSDQERAVQLYHKIRDGYWYNPYHISLRKEDLKASHLVGKKDGHCIEKSILLVSGLRAMGIPARLHLAAVKNHIGVERLEERFGTNLMTPHGMVNIYLNGKWVKTSPAFNIELCKKCNVAPLDFDGINDAVFQEFDKDGGKFMDYVEDYGHFEDVPLDFIIKTMAENYPWLKDKMSEDMIFKL